VVPVVGIDRDLRDDAARHDLNSHRSVAVDHEILDPLWPKDP
jgi:hypothetical protein